MIRWYEQSLDWLIAHTTIEIGFCIFAVGICGMIAMTAWVYSLTKKNTRTLYSDLDIYEAIKEARTPHTHCKASTTRK